MATRDENLQDLSRQSQTTGIVAPPLPPLAILTRSSAHPELQRAFETYDQQMREWLTRFQVANASPPEET